MLWIWAFWSDKAAAAYVVTDTVTCGDWLGLETKAALKSSLAPLKVFIWRNTTGGARSPSCQAPRRLTLIHNLNFSVWPVCLWRGSHRFINLFAPIGTSKTKKVNGKKLVPKTSRNCCTIYIEGFPSHKLCRFSLRCPTTYYPHFTQVISLRVPQRIGRKAENNELHFIHQQRHWIKMRNDINQQRRRFHVRLFQLLLKLPCTASALMLTRQIPVQVSQLPIKFRSCVQSSRQPMNWTNTKQSSNNTNVWNVIEQWMVQAFGRVAWDISSVDLCVLLHHLSIWQ